MSRHDGWPEHRPRLPGPSAPRSKGRKPFGSSWWGNAWVEALERRARLDPNRLPRGRTYARTGAVGTVTLAPGEIRAPVQGSRRKPYDVRIRVRQFSAREWDDVFDALASEIGHTAALLEGELPAEVADRVRSLGLDLLPGADDLLPRCSCPDWAVPCKHSAAVCYLVADALDEDAFGVLLLRGRERAQVLAALRGRRAEGATPSRSLGEQDAADSDEGVPAREVWRRTAPSAPRPAAPGAPSRPGRPTVLAADPPPSLGIDVEALRALAADAAARALELARGGASSGLELTEPEDLARRASALLGRTEGGDGLADLAERAGVPARQLLLSALAYRDGGTPGLAALVGAVDVESGAMTPGARLLGEGATVRRNRVTLGDRQLRLGPDGRWYPFRKQPGGAWHPDGPPVTAARDESDLGELEDEGSAGSAT